MTKETRNTQAVLEFYRLFYNAKRFDEGARLLAESFVNHHPGANGSGRQGMIDDFRRLARSNLSAFHIEAKRMIGADDFVWTHNLITGLPEGGRAVSVEIWRLEDGAIAEHWDVVQRLKPDQDPASML
ncbi:MAG TPA: nuclear transport factor 2 family protein [Pseudorhodoplanes sp.]|nr:nuclear transport factor 2 family protein [Pseudorhodoplanes sp.]